ncbi:MAG: hypothetical protein IJG09_05375 [Methanobrevibacter sp.]|nr:hypothetical protein [Methanobrevibacter sp.]
MKKLIIILLLTLMLLSPVSAEIITSKVDDKHIIHSYNLCSRIVHTVDFGDIEVSKEDYSKIMINDSITFNTNNWNFEYNILKINNKEV